MKSLDRQSEPEAPGTVPEEAADWLFRLKENPDDRELAESFQTWLGLDPAHERAWNRTLKAWKGLDPLAAGKTDTRISSHGQSRPAGAQPAVRRILPARKTAAACLAVAACLLLLLAPVWLLRLQADHYTGAGEIRTVRLEDGSTVTLAGASAIRTEMEGNPRRVVLLSGEAFFDVAHMPDRPFIVTAADLNVVVLGTEFNVRRGRETTSVALLNGSVQAHASNDLSQRFTLKPGQALNLQNADGTAQTLDVDPAGIAAWREHRLVVSNQSVASVAEQLGRYQSGWVTIPDRELASMRVTGVYDLSDPERALRTLVAPFGGQSHEITGYVHVLTR
ncbi:FecR family protein [Roseibium aggregatum]|uniref:FecR family protein n=1 Tax=Roseibium aggregatum TaxID=187304 RepID=A0A939EGE6_9HYPH|nr:FecR family protein [Roseibium aggregatum]MBN9672752.1 FecR family protein [Roseibium aggregatum]